MPDPRHSALDDFLRDYTDRRADELPKEKTIPDSHREALLECVRKGIPRAQARRRRTEYEDALEEKRIAKQSPRRGSASPGRSMVFGFVLRFLGAAVVLLIVAGITLWWMDRSSRNMAELAGTRGTQESTNSLIGGSDFFAPTTPASPTPAPVMTAATDSADAAPPSPTASRSRSAEPPAETVAQPAAVTTPVPAVTGAEPAPAPAALKGARGEYAQFAALAASVMNKASGVRVEFDQLPPQLQKQRNVIAPKTPLMFKQVRIVQNDKGIEVIDRWDGSFYQAKLKTVAPVAAAPAAREQATALLGDAKSDETVVRIQAEGTSFMINKKVSVTLDLPLERIPPDMAHIMAAGDADRAFEAWLTHCRIFGEAVVEGGERVVFEVVPTEE